MTKLPYFPMYPTDFEADTSHLTLAEDGAYNRLLRLMWMTPGCSLPDDAKWIMRRMRVDQDTFNTVVQPVIDEFMERKNGRIYSKRLSEERKKVDETSRKRSEAGKMGGRPKATENKQKPKKAGFDFDKAGPKQPEPEPEPYPDIEEDPPISPQTVLEAIAGKEAAESFLAYRRRSRHKAMTVTGAKRLAKQLTLIQSNGGDPSDALGEAEERGWATIKADWYQKSNDRKPHGKRDGDAAALAQRVGERWAAKQRARGLDSGQDSNPVVPLLPTRQPDGGSRGGH